MISPLRERWLQRTGDLLADTFVDAKGIQPYRWDAVVYRATAAAAAESTTGTCVFRLLQA